MNKLIFCLFLAINAVYRCQIPLNLVKWFQSYSLRYDDDVAVERLKQELSIPENKLAELVEDKDVEQNNGSKTLFRYNTYQLSDSTVENFRTSSDWSVDENLNCQKNQLYLAILQHCINQESRTPVRRSPFLATSAGSSYGNSPNVFRSISSCRPFQFSPTTFEKLAEFEKPEDDSSD
jgi:hypothetical protein